MTDIYTPADIRSALQKKKFDSWLVKQKPDEIVGTAGQAEFCPISNYLCDILPNLNWVSTEGATLTAEHVESSLEDDDKLTHVNLPLWAAQFVHHVDGAYTSPAEAGYSRSLSVTAAQALKVLRRRKK